MRKPRQTTVPSALVDRIDRALAHVDLLLAERDLASSQGAPVRTRRQLNTELTEAFTSADALLRAATEAARQRGCHKPLFQQWSHWRRRLSLLDAQFARHLFVESNDVTVLGLGEIRAVDTGMSGPSIGEMQHGDSRPGQTSGGYGLDMPAVLAARSAARAVA